jgi:hypothetical protein
MVSEGALLDQRAEILNLYRFAAPNGKVGTGRSLEDANGSGPHDGVEHRFRWRQPFLGRSLNAVSRSSPGSRGRPSTLSPRMLRWISSVPP